MEWQPMETAPKDGTDVWVYDNRGVEKAWYGKDPHTNQYGWWYGTGDDFSTGSYYIPIDPEGWMYTPEIPVH